MLKILLPFRENRNMNRCPVSTVIRSSFNISKKFMKMRKVLIAFALAGISLTACKKKTDNTPEADISYLQVVHAAPKVGEVLVNINQKKAQHKVQYLSMQKPYTAMLSGKDLPIQLTAGGNIVAESKVTFEKTSNYSLFIYDTLKNNKVKFVVLKDILTNPGPAKTNIRFLHLSPDMPEVDMDVFKGNDSLRLEKTVAYIGDNPSIAAYSTFKTITAGNYRVKVKTRAGSRSVTLLDIPTMKLEGQRSVTLFLSGLKNGTAGNETRLQLWQHK
jgi:Domain of unknown function (DUF4397)